MAMLLCSEARAASSPLTQTQEKIKKLDYKITNLQKILSRAHDKHSLLNEELSKTEKQMGEGESKLLAMQYDIRAKEHKVSELQRIEENLNKKLAFQQQLLTNHVRARYQMGEYQPLKWVLNQDSPYQMMRILTYYQYIVKSRQKIIDEIEVTGKKMNANKEQLHSELANTQLLQHQLSQHQQQLHQNKQYHTALIQSLNHEIQTDQQALVDFKKDKDNLSQVLQALVRQSMLQKNRVQNSRPFAQMRRKLPLPVQIKPGALQKMNQGVTFFAKEGSVVTAVYPGKIVFSNWLNGYGLLLIIDHGQGFMTLYANNHSLLKHKGQTVYQKEPIASVGHSGAIKQNGLYFEVRQRGKAIFPLNWFFLG